MTEKILFKGGGYAVLSNMSAYALTTWRGEEWMTTEHAYQAAKFADPELQQKIKNATSAYEAKMLASEHSDQISDDWLDMRVGVMEELLRAKVEQHPHVKKKLLDSSDAELIEDTDDSFWGRGKDGNGQNILGNLWMKIREELYRS